MGRRSQNKKCQNSKWALFALLYHEKLLAQFVKEFCWARSQLGKELSSFAVYQLWPNVFMLPGRLETQVLKQFTQRAQFLRNTCGFRTVSIKESSLKQRDSDCFWTLNRKELMHWKLLFLPFRERWRHVWLPWWARNYSIIKIIVNYNQPKTN